MLRLRYENFRSLNALEIEILNSDRYPTHRRQCWWNRFIYKRNDEVVPKIKLPLNCHFKLMIHEKWCSPLPLYLEGQFHVMMWQVGQTKLGHPTQRPHILQFPRLTSDSHRLVIPSGRHEDPWSQNPKMSSKTMQRRQNKRHPVPPTTICSILTPT